MDEQGADAWDGKGLVAEQVVVEALLAGRDVPGGERQGFAVDAGFLQILGGTLGLLMRVADADDGGRFFHNGSSFAGREDGCISDRVLTLGFR